ncbi:MAG TPA: replication/maintenance protein RepL [Arsenophonus nasoniae]|uniref:replication/maintenance protein RepL n=1 Tax=Arsenophonus nasoniae TaxID=638 RepID=UPI00387984F4
MRAKKVYSREEVITDITTGKAIVSKTSNVYRLPKEPSYIKLYVDDLINLFGLPKGESRILFELVKRMNYQGEIVINATIKRDICKDLGIGGKKPEQIVSNSIYRFLKADLLIRKGTGVYIANPHLFAKGEWRDIYDLRKSYIEMKIKYSRKGREMQTRIGSD